MKYYIQNTEAGYLGNAITFWGKNRRGYTAYLDKAEQFTEDEAREICLGNPEKNKAWPVDYIDKGAFRVTDSQYLDRSEIRDFTPPNE